MRLVIDLQSCQTDSRDRGIGRYAIALVQAISSELGAEDELVLAADMPDARRMRDLRNNLRRRHVRAQIVAYGYPATAHTDTAPAACRLAGQLRSRFFASLHPDVLLVTTFFETGTAYCMKLDWPALAGIATAAIGYDLIPLRFRDRYLANGDFFSRWYPVRLREFRNFDRILAISKATRLGLTDLAGFDGGRIAVIDGGFDGMLVADHDADDGHRHLRKLGVEQPFVLTVSNGDWRKNTVGSLEAFAGLPEPLQYSHQLVLTQIGDDVREALASEYAHLRDRVRVLGRVDDATLALLYRECKVFYFPSYFEGFGLPVLEAMTFNAPVLASNAGALPEVIHDPRALFDPNVPGEGAVLLARALMDNEFREELRRGAREHALTFTWKRTAQKALQALRALTNQKCNECPAIDAKPAWPAEGDLALMVDACMEAGEWGEQALENGLRAIERAGRRRVLVDITEIVRLDAKTGIQRVTRNFFAGLFAVARQSGCFEVEPFCWTELGVCYARTYAREHLNVPCMGGDEAVGVEPSDLVFMLDSSWWSPERFDELHDRVRAAGGEVVWMVHDLGPVRYPETCNPAVLPAFEDWLTHAARTADGFICNSGATRGDLESFIDSVDLGARRPWSQAVHLGCDFDPSVRSEPSVLGKQLSERLSATPYFFALGTLEPRKDYQAILDAFELLWARGIDAALVIVGGQGWNVEPLVERVRQHPEQGKRLIWLQGVADSDVRYLLVRAVALIQASIWEGFGLPLVEAGSLGVPLIASDIAVFREVAGECASYFPVGNSAALAELVVATIAERGLRSPTTVQYRSWWEASTDLADALGVAVFSERCNKNVGTGGFEARRPIATKPNYPRILVDITGVATLDAQTGIQRVTRNFYAGLAAVAQARGYFTVEPFCWTEQGIYYARQYARDRLGVSCDGPDLPVEVERADLVFMLDSSWFPPERFDSLHQRVHELGGEVVWMVYDLIPLRFPQTCDPGMPPAFEAWLTHAAKTSDGFVCDSEATRRDLESFLDGCLAGLTVKRPWTRSAYLGSDLDPSANSRPSERGLMLREKVGGVPYFVALGTLEPRKDYGTILDAFELLWKRGLDVALVILGKQGWNVDVLAERIRTHPERDRRLFWLQDAGDNDVRCLLKGAKALIQASISEGFGLPLVEAGSLGVPLIASDISVFHEVAGDSAAYFPVGDANALADAVSAGVHGETVCAPASVRIMDWQEASLKLAEVLGFRRNMAGPKLDLGNMALRNHDMNKTDPSIDSGVDVRLEELIDPRVFQPGLPLPRGYGREQLCDPLERTRIDNSSEGDLKGRIQL